MCMVPQPNLHQQLGFFINLDSVDWPHDNSVMMFRAVLLFSWGLGLVQLRNGHSLTLLQADLAGGFGSTAAYYLYANSSGGLQAALKADRIVDLGKVRSLLSTTCMPAWVWAHRQLWRLTQLWAGQGVVTCWEQQLSGQAAAWHVYNMIYCSTWFLGAWQYDGKSLSKY